MPQLWLEFDPWPRKIPYAKGAGPPNTKKNTKKTKKNKGEQKVCLAGRMLLVSFPLFLIKRDGAKERKKKKRIANRYQGLLVDLAMV